MKKFTKDKIKKVLKIIGITIASFVAVCALLYALAVAIIGGSFNFTDKVDITEYPDDIRLIYEAAKYNVPYSDSAVIATLTEDDGTNCIFKIDTIVYSNVQGKDYLGNDTDKNIYVRNKDIEVTISEDAKPYNWLDSFSFIVDAFYPNKYVNKYWNRSNLLCSLEIGKNYLLLIDDDSYTMEDPTHKAELVFIIDSDFPDNENYYNLMSYIGIIEGGYTGYSKDYTGIR